MNREMLRKKKIIFKQRIVSFPNERVVPGKGSDEGLHVIYAREYFNEFVGRACCYSFSVVIQLCIMLQKKLTFKHKTSSVKDLRIK